jgi:hypothetical protein
VQEILEVLAELTRHFDILIVDYGPDDEPDDTALELVREYPQVALIQCPDLREASEAMDAGLRAAAGEIIFVDEMSSPFRPLAARQLWQLRDERDQVQLTMPAGYSEVRRAPGLISANNPHTTLRMFQRALIGQPPPLSDQESEPRLDRLTRNDRYRPSSTSDGLPRILSRLRRLAAQ